MVIMAPVNRAVRQVLQLGRQLCAPRQAIRSPVTDRLPGLVTHFMKLSRNRDDETFRLAR
jgi:hypothetical protein